MKLPCLSRLLEKPVSGSHMLYICQKGRPYIGKLTSDSPHSNDTHS